MNRIPLRPLMIAAPLAALLAACGGSDAPEGEKPAELELRHDNFETDIVMVAAAARDINERAAAIEDHFPEGSGRDAGWDTEALPTIWEKPAEFTAAQQKLLEESAKMLELAEAGDVAGAGEQVGPLGASCKNCHDTFRLDDD